MIKLETNQNKIVEVEENLPVIEKLELVPKRPSLKLVLRLQRCLNHQCPHHCPYPPPKATTKSVNLVLSRRR